MIELNRIDMINRTPNPPALNQNLAANFKQAIRDCDGLLVVEQVRQDGFGALSPWFVKHWQKRHKPIHKKPLSWIPAIFPPGIRR